MKKMLDYIEYTNEEGKNIGKEIVVYALSTCGFCRRALGFLRDNNIAFTYVYVDKLDFDVKQKVKQDLKEKFEERVVFPYMVIDDQDVMVGFVKDDYESTLLS